MADQRDHGVGGLEWRGRPAGASGEPTILPTQGMPDSADETLDVLREEDGAGEQDRAEHGRPGHPGGRSEHVAPDGAPEFDVEDIGGFADHADDEDPPDLSALRADDELLAAIGAFDHSAGPADEDPALRALLVSWRMDVDAEPMAELVDARKAADLIYAAAQERRRRRRPRYLVPVACAAAVLVVAFSGMGLAARGAQPGDALWGLSQVLYSDHARSIEAAVAVRTDLDHAATEFHQGHLDAALTELAKAQSSLPSVSSEDGKAALQAQGQTLLAQLEATNGVTPTVTSTPTGTPTPVTTTTPTTTSPPSTTTSTPPPSTTTTTTPPTSTTTSTSPTTPSMSPQSSSAQQTPAGSNGAANGAANGGAGTSAAPGT